MKEWNKEVFNEKGLVLRHFVQIAILFDGDRLEVISVCTDQPEDLSLIMVFNDLESSVLKA